MSKNKIDQIQFSKLMVLFAVVFSMLFIIVSLIIALCAPELDPLITTTVIGVCGTILATTFVWYFKKAQAENSVKIYVGAYKSIIKFRQKYKLQDDELCDRIENSMLQNLDDVAEGHMDDATSVLEKVEVNI
jgi:hypothetical protein